MIKSYTYSTEIFKILHSTFGCQRGGGDAKIRDFEIAICFSKRNHTQKTNGTNYRTQIQAIGRYWGFGVDLLLSPQGK